MPVQEHKYTKRIKRNPKSPEPIVPEAIVPEPIVIFIASSTPEKIRDFQVIAESRHYPIIFEDIHKLFGSFHHADEISSDFKENAVGKLNAVDIDGLRNGKYDTRIENYCKDRGLPRTTQMYVASEDGGFSLRKDVWDKMDKDGIPEEVLKRIKPGQDANHTGPGVETAPVISALLGEYNFMERVKKAVADLGKNPKDVSMLQYSTMTLSSINKTLSSITEEDSSQLAFSASETSSLFYPNAHLMKELLKEQKVGNYHFSKANKNAEKTIAGLGAEGIVNHSVRAKLTEAIYNKFFSEEIEKGYQPGFGHELKKIINKEHPFRIGAFGSGDNDAKLMELSQKLKPGLGKDFTIYYPDAAYISDQGINGNGKDYGKGKLKSNYEILSNIEKVLAESDSAILFPDMREYKRKATTPEEKEAEKLAELMKLYTLFSLVVNKQLNPRDANKPVILLNHDGSWDDAIAIHNNLANLGMTKEYSISIPTKLGYDCELNKIHAQSNGYYHVLGTPKNGITATYEQTTNAAIELLKEKRKGYNPRAALKPKTGETGDKPENFAGFRVAIFCSANNENKYLNESVKELSYKLAKEGFGIIYGGGDRYTMGAVLDGVTKYRTQTGKAAYIAGYSTPEILKSETSKGEFSTNLNYAKKNNNIYERMADMLDNSDIVIAAPGGAGTVQEWAAALILNHARPAAEKKPVVFYNPPLNKENIQVWDVALQAVLGKEDYKLLTSETASAKDREKRCQELGIYVETTLSGVEKRISELRKQHEEYKKHNPAGYVARYATPPTSETREFRP